jgi:hypothetical protein
MQQKQILQNGFPELLDGLLHICTHHSEGADEISGKLCWLVAAICQEGDGLILQIGIVEKWYHL